MKKFTQSIMSRIKSRDPLSLVKNKTSFLKRNTKEEWMERHIRTYFYKIKTSKKNTQKL